MTSHQPTLAELADLFRADGVIVDALEPVDDDPRRIDPELGRTTTTEDPW